MKRSAPEESDFDSQPESDEFDVDEEDDVSGVEPQQVSSRSRSRPARATTKNFAAAFSAVTPPRTNHHQSRAKRRKLNEESHEESENKKEGGDEDEDDHKAKGPAPSARSTRQSRGKSDSVSKKSDEETEDKSNFESVEEKPSRRAPRGRAAAVAGDGAEGAKDGDAPEEKGIGVDLNLTDIIDAHGKRYPFRQRSFGPGGLTEKFPPIFRRRNRSKYVARPHYKGLLLGV
jgi:hypothetical protein